MRDQLRKLDAAVYRVERVVAAVLFIVMAVVMFASVLIRVQMNPEGRLATLLGKILGGLGVEIAPATLFGPIDTAINLVLTFLLCYAALRTMKTTRQITRPQALLYGAGAALALAGLVKVLLWAFPNNIAWAGSVSLACMLWVGFMGASIATYERRHLALEMGEKLWPRPVLPYVKAASFVAAAAMVAFLFVLAWSSLTGHYSSWAKNPQVGILLDTAIPEWAVFVIFPYTFFVMLVRFLALAVRAGTGSLGEEESESEVRAAEKLVGQSQKKEQA